MDFDDYVVNNDGGDLPPPPAVPEASFGYDSVYENIDDNNILPDPEPEDALR
jgi:hypothetical protein